MHNDIKDLNVSLIHSENARKAENINLDNPQNLFPELNDIVRIKLLYQSQD